MAMKIMNEGKNNKTLLNKSILFIIDKTRKTILFIFFYLIFSKCFTFLIFN